MREFSRFYAKQEPVDPDRKIESSVQLMFQVFRKVAGFLISE